MNKQYILGISAYYHDSAAAVIESGRIVAAAQEERFSRKKHDPAFPSEAIRFCLSEANISMQDLSAVVFYDKPFLTFDRLFESYMSYAPAGYISFLQRMPVWLKEKLMLKSTLRKKLSSIACCSSRDLPSLLFTEHHHSHAASAFYPSPFEQAVVLCMDGVGEWATTSVWIGKGNKLAPLWHISFPNSLGLLYSAFTQFCGFKVNSGEYKLMGLAPYGEPVYQDLIEDNLIDIKADGSFRLDMQYFDYTVGNNMTNKRFAQLFGTKARSPESEITDRERNLAASIQAVTEKIVLRLAKTISNETGEVNLCLAGGVALNCVANGKIASSGIFEEIWVQPASGDAGGAIGSALAGYYDYFSNPRKVIFPDAMFGSFLGPSFSNDEIRNCLDSVGASYSRIDNTELVSSTAKLLSNGQVVGWFQGNMEFGPRALGCRSILGDPRDPLMQKHLNLKIKFRESFRPFAPSILSSRAAEYFEYDEHSEDFNSPYMMFVARLKSTQKTENISNLPAVTHVDFTARVQTVSEDLNSLFYALLKAFEHLTDCPVLINTSFNIRGEPIVCSPEDAWRCFMHTDMDYLVIGNYILCKSEQSNTHKEHFAPQIIELD